MAKYVKIIINNWKKSTIGAVAVVYGINYAHDKYKIDQLMRAYCEEAEKYGDIPVPPTLKPRHVTVILNPAANRRKAKTNYEKYCAPLLHLAGYRVDVIQTESEGQARILAADLKDTDVIVVAGGDGTLSEIVTGLMRSQGSVRYPIGVLPLGRTNSVACSLLGRNEEGVGKPQEMAAAAMAVVRGQTKAVDALKVDVIQEGEGLPKTVYGLSGIKWGVFRDALSRQDSYWYLGMLRGYAAVLFNSLYSESVSAHIVFTHACNGCNRCYQTRKDLHPSNSWRWYNYVIPSFSKKTPELQQINYRQVVNNQCGIVSEVDLAGSEINISSPCICQNTTGIQVSLGSLAQSWTDYIEEGWRRVRGEPATVTDTLEAQQLDIYPVMEFKENEEKWFSIDNEDFEVRPIRVTLMPKVVRVYIPEQPQTNESPEERSAQEKDFKKVFSTVDPSIPLVCICGNHDIGENPTKDSINKYKSSFGDDYFSFHAGGVFFICINSQFYRGATNVPDLIKEQDQWLDLQLEIAKRSPTQTIVFQHVPLFVDNPDTIGNNTHEIELIARKKMLKKLTEARVKYVFCGHLHKNGGGKYKDLECIVTSAIGYQLGSDKSGMRVVKVYRNRVKHQYYGLSELPAIINL